jgi:hypothetical protein
LTVIWFARQLGGTGVLPVIVLRLRPIKISAISLFVTFFLPFTPIAIRAAAQTVSAGPTEAITSAAAESGLRKQWNVLFDGHSWAELDLLAEKLRSQRLRFEGGGWQLHVLYCVLSTGCLNNQTDAEWESRIAALQEWILYAPASPTPRIALADAYKQFAWKARGNGFIGTVSPQGQELFDERVQKAREALEESEEIGRNDPEWYNAMVGIAIDQGWTRAKVEALADEALRREPGYFYVVRVAGDYLLPKWYGTPGDTEKFVDAAANKIGGIEGDATYFFVAEILLVNEIGCSKCSQPSMSWARIQRGYAAIQRLYGINNYEINALAFLAVHFGDAQTAQHAFTEIGENWDHDVWGSKALFDRARTFSHPKPVPLAPSER